jgi:putative Ca2+/H+ antiporter (TMEM165/GDT1 family)
VTKSVEDDSDWLTFEDKESNSSVDNFISDKYILLKVSILYFIAYFGEGSVGDWSGIYLSSYGASPLVCVGGFVGFQLFVAIGRYYSDHLVKKIGRRKLLFFSGIISAVGLGVVVAGPYITSSDNYVIGIAIAGFTVFGIGMCIKMIIIITY